LFGGCWEGEAGSAMVLLNGRVTYAQNREDLVLLGLLKTVEAGFYVDVGANHPEHDSVTRIFYDRGWSGINLEPNPELHRLLTEQRGRDVNLKLGLASMPGRMQLRWYSDLDGLSTFSQGGRAQMLHDRPDARYVDIDCEVSTLAAVFFKHRPEGPIHFAKIDVEGLEVEVVAGNDWERFRPWVLCIERVLDAGRRAAASALLGAHRYTLVFFDGINDFWVSHEKVQLWRDFSYAGSIVLSGSVGLCESVTANPLLMDELLLLEGDAFVDAAYLTVLQRVSDPSGRDHYVRALASGVDKRQVIQALAASDEAADRGLAKLIVAADHPERSAVAQSPPTRSILSRLLGR